MVVTVTTAKDTLANIRRFVETNLANGVDHMIIFLDAPDAEVEAWLRARPEVTVIVCDASWWGAKRRPPALNKRQRVNANIARLVLAMTDWADWLFHIDADEVACVDREALAKVPADCVSVRLQTFEAVSQMHAEGTPTRFKRLLSKEDLQLLFSLGHVTRPANQVYFRSHIIGKCGVRPRLDVWLTIHNSIDRTGAFIKPYRDPGLRVLHYESYSGEDFVRKWRSMIGSGPRIHFGPDRLVLANGMKALLSKELDPEVVTRYLTEIYQRHMEDPVEVLEELGLLEHIDAHAGTHRPELLTEAQRTALADAFDKMRPERKAKLALVETTTAREAAAELTRIYGTRPSGPAPGRPLRQQMKRTVLGKKAIPQPRG